MFTVTMLFIVLQIVFVVPKVNHALSGKSVLQMLKLHSRTDQILAANAVDHFFWRKDLRNISDYNFDKQKKNACTPAMHKGQMDLKHSVNIFQHSSHFLFKW